ncbi:hypothetical protein DL96DRAFT_1713301 [Flagelloscypha sp. PMI_526]|nr:hypothetical protein DL96DRAFT_1713301 [Flagelloscypha sp. PMI_526]
MGDAMGSPGTLYELKDDTNTAATQTVSAIELVPPSLYNAVKTTYAIGVGGDGGTTYILSQEITRIDFFDSVTSIVSTNTESHTVVQTMVAGADYQKGTNVFLTIDSVTPSGLPQMEYSCSYNLGQGSGQCVQAYAYPTTTHFETRKGGLQAVATLSPFPSNSQVSGTQSSGTKHKVSTGAIVGGVIGGILALGFLFAILFVLRRRRLRSRRY